MQAYLIYLVWYCYKYLVAVDRVLPTVVPTHRQPLRRTLLDQPVTSQPQASIQSHTATVTPATSATPSDSQPTQVPVRCALDFVTSAKEVMWYPAFICLSVDLAAGLHGKLQADLAAEILRLMKHRTDRNPNPNHPGRSSSVFCQTENFQARLDLAKLRSE